MVQLINEPQIHSRPYFMNKGYWLCWVSCHQPEFPSLCQEGVSSALVLIPTYHTLSELIVFNHEDFKHNYISLLRESGISHMMPLLGLLGRLPMPVRVDEVSDFNVSYRIPIALPNREMAICGQFTDVTYATKIMVTLSDTSLFTHAYADVGKFW